VNTPRILVGLTVPMVAASMLVGCGSAGPSGQPTPTTSAPSATSSSPTPSQTPTGTEVQVPVYWAGSTSRGPLLYREFRQGLAPAGPTGPAVAALEVMFAGQPLDPDYRSLWPQAMTVESVSVDGPTATVALAGPLTKQVRTADSPDVQQLVHTVTAALDGVDQVTVTVNGTELVAGPVRRAPQVDVLAPVWVIEPQQGATVTRPLRVSGSASVFEATVSWEVRQDGAVVRSGFTTATVGAPMRGTWQVVVRGLAPGTYDVVAWETSMKDGSRMFVDDKTVEVG
jgi:hypothetical protein